MGFFDIIRHAMFLLKLNEGKGVQMLLELVAAAVDRAATSLCREDLLSKVSAAK